MHLLDNSVIYFLEVVRTINDKYDDQTLETIPDFSMN